MHEGSRRAIVAAFLANLGIAIAKFVGFAITGSSALLAEAVHSVADTGNQGLLVLGARRAERAASPEHPFGFGRERYFWAFVVALVLFSVGGLFAIYEGFSKLADPHDIESAGVAIGILGVAIALETGSMITAAREANKVRGRAGWWTFVRRSKSPELPVVLLEDLGALVGLVFAMAGVLLTLATGDPIFDALGSIAIGVLLVGIALVLTIEMKSLLIGEAAGPEDEAAIRAALVAEPAVRRVIHMRTQHVGPDTVLIGAKVEFDPDLSVAALAEAVDAAEARVRAALPIAELIYVEPDLQRPEDRPPSPG